MTRLLNGFITPPIAPTGTSLKFINVLTHLALGQLSDTWFCSSTKCSRNLQFFFLSNFFKFSDWHLSVQLFWKQFSERLNKNTASGTCFPEATVFCLIFIEDFPCVGLRSRKGGFFFSGGKVVASP